MKEQQVIIIGAGRSGTNMLRDILEQLPGVATWDCDEINPVWRHGNARFPTDELLPKQISKSTQRAVKSAFASLARKNQSSIVLEKTCANSLRVPFVYELLPDAKFIFIFRDGRDVVPSAMKRWTSKLDISYTLKKMRYVPWLDFPYYLYKFGMNRVNRMLGGKEKLSFWGPIYEGMSEDVGELSLAQVCAKQWSKCVLNTIDSMWMIPDGQQTTVRYEEFVSNPEKHVQALAKFIGVGEISSEKLTELTSSVSTKSVGSYKKNLSDAELEEILPICELAMTKSGYSNG